VLNEPNDSSFPCSFIVSKQTDLSKATSASFYIFQQQDLSLHAKSVNCELVMERTQFHILKLSAEMYFMQVVGYTLSDCKRNEVQTANSINNTEYRK
jgi:hypothetical protein